MGALIPKILEGSFPLYQQSELEGLYLNVLRELDDSATLIIPAPNGGDLATLQTRARHADGIDGEQWIASEALEFWDTKPSTQGVATVVKANGSDEFLTGPTSSIDAYWTPISGGSDIAFSVGMWLRVDVDISNARWLAKDGQATKQTWGISSDSASHLGLVLLDNSEGSNINRGTSSTYVVGQWVFVVFAYNNGGANTDIKPYFNAVSDDGDLGSSGAYTAMEAFDDEAVTMFARDHGTRNFAEGAIWFAFYVLEDLAAGSGPERIKNIYDMTKPYIGIQ